MSAPGATAPAACAPSAPACLQLATAGPADAPALLALINSAYQVETYLGADSGDGGVGFKKTDRLDTLDDALEMLATSTVTVATDARGRIVGAMSHLVKDDGWLYFGPFAVDPSAQGAGVGRALLQHVEQLARSRGCHGLEITVVNCRSDILPMYERLGFVEVGTEPFPHPWRIHDARQGEIWMRVMRRAISAP